ncbi:MAG: hypothetical protein P8Z80_19180 [Pseudolabrys sp.]
MLTIHHLYPSQAERILFLVRRNLGVTFGETEEACISLVTGRDGYKRA